MDREELGRQAWEMRAALLRLAMSILKRPQDAEDAVSDAIVRAFERLDTLRNDSAAMSTGLAQGRRRASGADNSIAGRGTGGAAPVLL